MSTIETSASYEALDAQGRPYLRAPMWIHELPDPKTRCRALSKATTRIEDHLALVAFKDIGFGEPAYVAFGMSRPQAQAHQASKLLPAMGNGVRHLSGSHGIVEPDRELQDNGAAVMKVRQMGKRRAARAAYCRTIWLPRWESFWWTIDGYEPTPQHEPRAFHELQERRLIPGKHATSARRGPTSKSTAESAGIVLKRVGP